VVIDAQFQKVKEVMKVNFPIKFSKGGLRQVGPGQFTRDALEQELIVGMERQVTRSLLLQEKVRGGVTQRLFATLSTGRSLLPELFG
jgi:hypothetical protein